MAGAVVAGGALAVTASSVLATPQPLENALEGEGRIFRFRTGDVFYTVAGPADAPPVLLLHSVHLSASSFEWRNNFSALSQSFRVYAPDLVGFGLSDRPAMEYSADLYVHLITDFAREVIARPTILVARNHTAAFAVRSAYLDSKLFPRLALISPTGILWAVDAEGRDWLTRSGDALQGILGRIGPTTAGQVPFALLTTKPSLAWLVAHQSYTRPEQVTPEVIQHLFATTHQFGARFAPLAFMSGKLDIDVASDFAALQQPILLVWGEQDAINDPSHAAPLTRLNLHTRLEVIAQAGNAVQEEQAEEVNELLHAWFLAPLELVDPTLREPTSEAALYPSAPAEPVTSPAPMTTAAPLTTPLPETTLEAFEEETPASHVEAPTEEETPPSYVEAPTDETPSIAMPPAANPEAAPAAFATEEVNMASASPEEAAVEEASPPEKTAEAYEAPASPGVGGATAQTSELLAQTEAQAAIEMREQAAPMAAPPARPKEEPAAPAKKTPETPTAQPPRKETQRGATPRSTGARSTASGQAKKGKAAQQGTPREGTRQARPDSGDKPQTPRRSGQPRKNS